MMKRSGFTLIELLVVLVIMGILAGAMVPMIRANRLTAQQAKAAADLDAIKTATLIMHNDCGAGQWPTGGVSPGTNTGDGIIDDTVGCPDAGNWDGPYLDEWRNDPWGRPYAIYDNGIVAPIIRRARSIGPDGIAGNADDIGLRITPDTAI